MRKLAPADISDLRAYERERDAFRSEIIAMKRRRRIALGPILTITFENTATMRFQVQEMARAERMLSDEQIQVELDTYNELIPNAGCLVATLFVELTTKDDLIHWLPRLVGIQRAISFQLADGTLVPGQPQDEERLTREETTASVHYLSFAFPSGVSLTGAAIVVDHTHYPQAVPLTAEQVAELQGDLVAG